MSTVATPTPDAIADETKEFRRRLASGRFCVQVCGECGTVHFPPGPACWRCGSDRLEWLDVDDRRGAVASATTCHRSFMQFADEVPYTVVLGELTAHPGVRVIARLRTDEVDTAIGADVELHWHTPCVGPPTYWWQSAASHR